MVEDIPTGARTGTSSVQIQFDRLGEHAELVSAWMARRYPHIGMVSRAQPGLTIGMRVPHREETFRSWHARLVSEVHALDVALEVAAECFTELELPEASMVALHMTRPLDVNPEG